MLKRILPHRLYRQVPEFNEGATFLRKWGFIGILIGVCAGLGALALTWSIHLITHWMLGVVAGYTPPRPGAKARWQIMHFT
jgi:hypothetical protein